jgi:hypothetical protein
MIYAVCCTVMYCVLQVTGLWNPKRKQQIEKLRPTCSNLDQAMSYFQGIKEAVDAQPAVKDIDFLQIDVAPVAAGVAKQAELWKAEYGDALFATSNGLLVRLQSKIGLLEEQVAAETADLEQLKFVLNVITDIQKMMQVTDSPTYRLTDWLPHIVIQLPYNMKSGRGAGHGRHSRALSHAAQVQHSGAGRGDAGRDGHRGALAEALRGLAHAGPAPHR